MLYLQRTTRAEDEIGNRGKTSFFGSLHVCFILDAKHPFLALLLRAIIIQYTTLHNLRMLWQLVAVVSWTTSNTPHTLLRIQKALIPCTHCAKRRMSKQMMRFILKYTLNLPCGVLALKQQPELFYFLSY